jgi:hypothetical protein
MPSDSRRDCCISKINRLPLKKLEDLPKGLCAMDGNGIIIFELPLLTSVTPTCTQYTGYKYPWIVLQIIGSVTYEGQPKLNSW